MKIINFFRRKRSKYWKSQKSSNLDVRALYNILENLESQDNSITDKEIIDKFRDIRVSTNVNSVVWFYLPLVCHTLFFRPNLSNDILYYLVDPIFANGTFETEEVIMIIKSTLDYKMGFDENYISEFGMNWINNSIYDNCDIIESIIYSCWIELDDSKYYEEATGNKWNNLITKN